MAITEQVFEALVTVITPVDEFTVQPVEAPALYDIDPVPEPPDVVMVPVDPYVTLEGPVTVSVDCVALLTTSEVVCVLSVSLTAPEQLEVLVYIVKVGVSVDDPIGVDPVVETVRVIVPPLPLFALTHVELNVAPVGKPDTEVI